MADEDIARSFFQAPLKVRWTALGAYQEVEERDADPWPYLTGLRRALDTEAPA